MSQPKGSRPASTDFINVDSFRAWHDQYRERLVNSMTSVIKNRDLAEDVTAAALAKALEEIRRFRGSSRFDTWVHAIAWNEARRHLSQRQAVPLESIIERKDCALPDIVADAPERSECRDKLHEALSRMPVIYRRVLVDHFVRGLSRQAHRPAKSHSGRNRPQPDLQSQTAAARRLGGLTRRAQEPRIVDGARSPLS